MPKGEADNFREYLYNATNAQLANGTSCADQFGGDCYGNGGSCIPKYNPESGVYNFQCENPRRAGKVGDWEYDVYVIGLEVAQYFNSQDGYPKWWGHHTENLPTSPYYYYPGKLPTQHGIFGYNQVKVSQDQTDLGTCKWEYFHINVFPFLYCMQQSFSPTRRMHYYALVRIQQTAH